MTLGSSSKRGSALLLQKFLEQTHFPPEAEVNEWLVQDLTGKSKARTQRLGLSLLDHEALSTTARDT